MTKENKITGMHGYFHTSKELMAKSDNCLFFPSTLWNAYYVQGAKDT